MSNEDPEFLELQPNLRLGDSQNIQGSAPTAAAGQASAPPIRPLNALRRISDQVRVAKQEVAREELREEIASQGRPRIKKTAIATFCVILSIASAGRAFAILFAPQSPDIPRDVGMAAAALAMSVFWFEFGIRQFRFNKSQTDVEQRNPSSANIALSIFYAATCGVMCYGALTRGMRFSENGDGILMLIAFLIACFCAFGSNQIFFQMIADVDSKEQ